MSQPSFSFHGKYHNFNEARAVPRPYQTPHPPIRIAGASEDTFPVLGALGYPLFVAVRSGSLSGLAPDLDAYREAYTEAGHPGKGEVHLRLTMHVAETDAEAQAQAHDTIMSGYKKLVTQLEGSPNPRRRAQLADVQSLTYDAAMREKVVIGSPDTVAARLSELQDQLGIDGILAELNFGALLPPEHMMRSCELLLREVRPRLRPAR
jgi:alkanesulfonate monooxygenase SsuD/methylene tetrahydromethanopterin reductase-like flavin-dependent oxidoreductase (luciferase family)